MGRAIVSVDQSTLLDLIGERGESITKVDLVAGRIVFEIESDGFADGETYTIRKAMFGLPGGVWSYVGDPDEDEDAA